MSDDDNDLQDDEIKRFELNYSPELIKARYIYPFNQTKQRKENVSMLNQHISTLADNCIYYLPRLQTDTNLIYEQVKFQFPYSKIRLTTEIIENIQTPIKVFHIS